MQDNKNKEVLVGPVLDTGNEKDEAVIDSTAFFRTIWWCLKISAVLPGPSKYPILFGIYDIFVWIVILIYYPIHIVLAAFSSPSTDVNIRNMSMFVVTAACSLKFIFMKFSVKKILAAEGVLKKLDKRVILEEDRIYHHQIIRTIRLISRIFLVSYFVLAVSSQATVLAKGERALLIPAWFPFDWRQSMLYYQIANAYQLSGHTILLVMNYVNDCYPPMAVCLLNEHLKLFGKRLSRIGYDDETPQENERKLREAIQDQKLLYQLFDLYQEILRWPLFVCFLTTTFLMSSVLVALLFFASGFLDRFYYVMYIICCQMEILPACYYGTHLEILLGELHNHIYHCNWLAQSRRFKRDMMIFTERSLKPTIILVGGMFRLHMDFFIATIKGAYSLFTILTRMRVKE